MTCTSDYPRTRLPPVSSGKTIRTATKPPRVLVLSKTQGLFLDHLADLRLPSVTLSPCCRLRPPDAAETPYIVYGNGAYHEPPQPLDIPKLMLLDAVAIRYLNS